MIDITLTVPNGTSTSDSQMVGNAALRSELGIAAIQSPAGLTDNTGRFEISDDGSTWTAVQDTAGSAITFSLKASKITIMAPDKSYFVKPYIRLITTSNVGAESAFKVYFREVS